MGSRSMYIHAFSCQKRIKIHSRILLRILLRKGKDFIGDIWEKKTVVAVQKIGVFAVMVRAFRGRFHPLLDQIKIFCLCQTTDKGL